MISLLRCPEIGREAKKPPKYRLREVQKMPDEKERLPDVTDEELIDTLTAISVISKRLAKKLRRENAEKEMKEKEDEQNE